MVSAHNENDNNYHNLVSNSESDDGSYEGTDDDEEVEMVSAHNKNNYNYDVVSYSESGDKAKENVCGEQVENKIEMTPKTAFNPKVV